MKRRAQLNLKLSEDGKRATLISTTVPESEVLRGVLALLAKHPSVAFAHRINTRVLDVEDAKSKTGKRPLFTAPKGHPDICGMLRGGRALYVEAKSTNGYMSDEQEAFRAKVKKDGGLFIVARSVDDVLRMLPLGRQDAWRGIL